VHFLEKVLAANATRNTVAFSPDNLLFTATKSSQRGNDGIISKALNGVNVRTREGDKYWLNGNTFWSTGCDEQMFRTGLPTT